MSKIRLPAESASPSATLSHEEPPTQSTQPLPTRQPKGNPSNPECLGLLALAYVALKGRMMPCFLDLSNTADTAVCHAPLNALLSAKCRRGDSAT